MIRSFRQRGIERFFLIGRTTGIQPKHADRLRLQLVRLSVAKGPHDMNAPAWRLHALKGKMAGNWAVRVDENWRLTFAFDEGDAILVDYQDYH